MRKLLVVINRKSLKAGSLLKTGTTVFLLISLCALIHVGLRLRTSYWRATVLGARNMAVDLRWRCIKKITMIYNFSRRQEVANTR